MASVRRWKWEEPATNSSNLPANLSESEPRPRNTIPGLVQNCPAPKVKDAYSPEARFSARSRKAPGRMKTGFVLLIGRVKAIAQVCGYLILENGIYLFGLLLINSTPLLVESGILLDLVVGVFVLGIIVDRIQRAFDSLDTRKLTALRE